jgi:hypothetical protein
MGDTNKVDERIARVDGLVDSPKIRAGKVFQALKPHDFTNWDLICFSVEWLAGQSLVFNWLTGIMKDLASKLYYAHYYMGDEIGLYILPEEK